MRLYTAGIPPSEGSHVCVVGEVAHILFPESVLSHFNPPALPPLLWAQEKERKNPPQPTDPTVQCNVAKIELQFLLKIDCEWKSLFCQADSGVLIETISAKETALKALCCRGKD